MIARMRKNVIDLYIREGASEQFSHPELYPPLYRLLYDSLASNEKPPFLNDDVIRRHKEDIDALSTTFDRYLYAIYPSKFEASNPVELSAIEAKNEFFESYLEERYLRASESPDTINYNRLKKFIKEVSGFKAFPKGSDSAQYKIMNTMIKASMLNNNWRGLVSYDRSLNNQSMDNIVDFNMSRDEKSVENTAIIKMIVSEIDNGREDGDDTYSRNIMLIPFVLNFIVSVVEDVVFNYASTDRLSDIELTKWINVLSGALEIERLDLNYSNANQKLKDYFIFGLLKNIGMNSIVAKRKSIEFLANIDFDVDEYSHWVVSDSDDDDVFRTFNLISSKKISAEFFDKAKILRDLLAQDDLLMPHGKSIKLKIAIIILSKISGLDGLNVKEGLINA